MENFLLYPIYAEVLTQITYSWNLFSLCFQGMKCDGVIKWMGEECSIENFLLYHVYDKVLTQITHSWNLFSLCFQGMKCDGVIKWMGEECSMENFLLYPVCDEVLIQITHSWSIFSLRFQGMKCDGLYFDQKRFTLSSWHMENVGTSRGLPFIIWSMAFPLVGVYLLLHQFF